MSTKKERKEGGRGGGGVGGQMRLISFGDVTDTARITAGSGGPWSGGAWSQSGARTGPLAFIAPGAASWVGPQPEFGQVSI